MGAVVALRRRPLVRVDVQGIIRTGLHARLTADAALVVEVHYPVLASEQRGSRADSGTR